MADLYREFTIRNEGNWRAFCVFMKANNPACIEAGKPLRLIVTQSDAKRNTEQNRRLWGYVYRTIAEQAWVDGKQYSADVWHEYFARKFGVCEDVTLPDGEIIVRRKSTTQMTVKEFADYMTRIEVEAGTELGVELL